MSTAPPPDAIRSMVEAPPASPPAGLPLPRLILRLGGLGNRKFGRDYDNGIDEDPQALQATAATACREIFAVIQETLEAILAEDRSPANVYPLLDPGACPWWKTWLAGRVLGKADRWDREALAGKHAAVFSDAPPLIQILTGGTIGGDTIIVQAAGEALSSVPFEQHLIVPKDPAEVPEGGLGIGSMPPAWQGEASRLPRAAAVDRGRVHAQRVFATRAQSAALRLHSDILLAVWDRDLEAKSGGTAETVTIALQEGVPVIAVRVCGPGPAEVEILRSRDDLREHDDVGMKQAPVPWQASLREVLERILKFPDTPPSQVADHPHPQPAEPKAEAKPKPKLQRSAGTGDHPHRIPSAYHPRVAFSAFREDRPMREIWPGRLWRGFDRVVKERAHIPTRPKTEDERLDATAVFWGILGLALPMAPMPFPPAAGDHGTYAHHYGRAKKRADRQGMGRVYGDAYRGAIIASYVLATVAVFMAAFAAILAFFQSHHEYHDHMPWGVGPALAIAIAVLAFIEVVVIAVMYFLATASQVEDWHEAYTDSRILAEALRMMKFLGPMGVHTPMPRLPHYLRQDFNTPVPEAMWSVWYFRALVRMAPLRLRSETTGLAADRDRLLREVDKQIDHHANKAKRQGGLQQSFHNSSNVLFLAVFACAFIHLADAVFFHTHHWSLFILTILLCMGGPALIAGLHGFSSQLEVERLRQRSSSMASILRERRRLLAQMKVDSAEAPVVWGLTVEALATASLMMDETASWSMLYRNTDIHAG